jgi:replicative superfamily II helicase
MARFLIESTHESERMACARAIQIFLKSGSHFVTNAEWGCGDGDHRAWIIVDVPTREDARQIVPPAYRSRAKIIALNRFTLQEIEEMLRTHEG